MPWKVTFLSEVPDDYLVALLERATFHATHRDGLNDMSRHVTTRVAKLRCFLSINLKRGELLPRPLTCYNRLPLIRSPVVHREKIRCVFRTPMNPTSTPNFFVPISEYQVVRPDFF